MLCYHCFQNKEYEGACPHCGYDPASEAEDYPLSLKQGAILNGRYTVGHVLGQGGFGITYVALDYKTKKRVAIKEYLPTDLAGRTSGTSSVQVYSGNRQEYFLFGKGLFLEEAKTLSNFIGDAHIVRIHSYFEENGTTYFVMEYVDGPTLGKYISQHGGRLPMETANRLLLPVMEALEAVHAKGIVHRDIAPDNILIAPGGAAKLSDFGAARYSTGEKSKSLDMVIKHGFAPKEQYTRHGRQGPCTDVYAMAATYYYAITGKIPPDSIDRIDEDNLIPPSTLGVKILPEAEAALLKALEVSSADRYQTMAEFRTALVKVTEEEKLRLLREERERLERELAALRAKETREQEVQVRLERELLAREERERKAREALEEKARKAREKREEKVLRAQAAKEEKERWGGQAALPWEEKPSAGPVPKPPSKGFGERKAFLLGAVLMLVLLVGVLFFKGRAPASELPASPAPELPEAGEALPQPEASPEMPRARTAQELAYLDAEALLADGKPAHAALAFHKLGDYADAPSRSRDAWRAATVHNSIAAGLWHVIALKIDGTAVSTGSNVMGSYDSDGNRRNYSEKRQLSSWKNLVSVAACEDRSLGLKSDGTVLDRDDYGHSACDGWQDIVSIAACGQTCVGLRADGSVLVSGSSRNPMHDAESWTDIVAVTIGAQHIVGLKNDGTCVAAGLNNSGQCDVSAWENIVAVAAGRYHTIGVNADGVCVAVGWNDSGQCDVSGWTDIVAVCAGKQHTVGLKADGTCVTAGLNKSGQCDVAAWPDIAEICAGEHCTVGRRRDGTCVITGFLTSWSPNIHSDDVRDLQGWSDIGLPAASPAEAPGKAAE